MYCECPHSYYLQVTVINLIIYVPYITRILSAGDIQTNQSLKLTGPHILEQMTFLHSQDLRCSIMVDQNIVTKLMLVYMLNKTHCAIHIFVMIEVKTAPIHDDTQSWEEYPMVSVLLYSGRLTVYHANRKPILSSKVMFISILCLLMSLEIMWRDAT